MPVNFDLNSFLKDKSSIAKSFVITISLIMAVSPGFMILLTTDKDLLIKLESVKLIFISFGLSLIQYLLALVIFASHFKTLQEMIRHGRNFSIISATAGTLIWGHLMILPILFGTKLFSTVLTKYIGSSGLAQYLSLYFCFLMVGIVQLSFSLSKLRRQLLNHNATNKFKADA